MRHVCDIKMEKGHAAGEVGLKDGGRKQVLTIISHHLFEELIMGVIVFNCCVMALTHWGEPAELTFFIAAVREICSLIFTAEAVLKIYGYGAFGYFSLTWNRFDFTIVVAAWLSIGLRIMGVDAINPVVFKVVQVVHHAPYAMRHTARGESSCTAQLL
jgi:hypothetical protein